MNDFFMLWKKEHQQILQLLDKLMEAGIDNKEWRAQLLDVKDKVISHLKMEDEKLYPFFRQKAKDEPRVQCLIDLFEEEMKEISKQALVFFKKYEQESNVIEFLEDLKGINAALRKRIWNEENILLEEYHRISQRE